MRGNRKVLEKGRRKKRRNEVEVDEEREIKKRELKEKALLPCLWTVATAAVCHFDVTGDAD
jgi:hypothetical protein